MWTSGGPCSRVGDWKRIADIRDRGSGARRRKRKDNTEVQSSQRKRRGREEEKSEEQTEMAWVALGS
jgi:hypothetical protein